MAQQRQPRIVLVTRETRMENLLRRWATKGQAHYQFKARKAGALMKAGQIDDAIAVQQSEDADFLNFDDEDATYQAAVSRLTRELDFGIPVQELDRQYLPSYDFDLCACVVVVGQDGLVANTAKYVGDIPIVGVNPDPDRFDGVLLPFHLEHARDAVSRVLKQQAFIRDVTLAQVVLDDGQTLTAFNDFFIGARSHVSARYQLQCGDVVESQSSSGILISTGAGSTGWMSSVYNMARGVANWLGQPLDEEDPIPMDWDAPKLLWAVREPFLSQTSGVNLVAGQIVEGEEMIIESQMSVDGVLFSDGIEADFLDFNGGSIARIGVAERRAKLVVPSLRLPPRR